MPTSGSTIQVQSNPAIPSINWVNTLFLTTTALTALIGMPFYIYFVGISWSLIGVFVFYVAATGLSITGGYHRLFAHRSYDANHLVKLFYLLFGAAACENSALKWAADHRDHHRFVDREGDPYNIRLGFFYAHIGWVFLKRPEDRCLDRAGDLLRDPLVYWQHRFYLPIAILVGGVLPLLIGYLLDDALGCFLLAGVTRTVVVHHSTFFINSLCHFLGKQPYSLKDTSRDNPIVAILTMGEGYHNFHHRFQYDYRNGIRWYHFDPTKWLIRTLAIFRLAKDLRKASDVHIFKARLEVQRDQLQQKLMGFSQEFRMATERTIHANHAALLAAYADWRNIKFEYRSARQSVVDRRDKLILELKKDLRKARSHFKVARAAWALLSRQCMQVPG
jgi:stearoyl-CoA desaturase (delta-9 desaturase)